MCGVCIVLVDDTVVDWLRVCLFVFVALCVWMCDVVDVLRYRVACLFFVWTVWCCCLCCVACWSVFLCVVCLCV